MYFFLRLQEKERLERERLRQEWVEMQEKIKRKHKLYNYIQIINVLYESLKI